MLRAALIGHTSFYDVVMVTSFFNVVYAKGPKRGSGDRRAGRGFAEGRRGAAEGPPRNRRGAAQEPPNDDEEDDDIEGFTPTLFA